MPILSGPEAHKIIHANLSRCKWARVAVAFWGEGAIEKLGLEAAAKRKADIEVVCDLMSGGCNPLVIRRLRSLLGTQRVLTRDSLHAKVWITDVGAILGSSNASANGLGHEGQEVEGLIEANLVADSSCTEEIASWRRWYQNQARTGAETITDPMLRTAEERWRLRRVGRDVGGAAGSLLEKIRQEPIYFRDKRFIITIYKHDYQSKEAHKLHREAKQESFLSDVDFYEGWHVGPSTFILDFDWNPKQKTAKLEGLYQTLDERPYRRGHGTSILLVRSAPQFEYLGIPRGDRRAWGIAATQVKKQAAPRRAELTCSAERFAELLRP
jgi:hypothetical protein